MGMRAAKGWTAAKPARMGRMAALSRTRSTLFRTRTAGLPAAMSARRVRSPGWGARGGGTASGARRDERGGGARMGTSATKTTTEAARAASRAASFIMRPSSVLGRWRPGVSSRAISAAPWWTTPRMASRVVCGVGETMERGCSSAALRIVDLPTLGRPMMATVPARRVRSATAGSGRRPAGRFLLCAFGWDREAATGGALADGARDHKPFPENPKSIPGSATRD